MSNFKCEHCGKYIDYDSSIFFEIERLEKVINDLKTERNDTVKKLRGMIAKMARDNKKDGLK